MPHIALAPNLPTAYDRKMIADLSDALELRGATTTCFKEPMNDQSIDDTVEQTGCDVVFRINRYPPNEKYRRLQFKHISWFQDVFPSTANGHRSFEEGDLTFTLGTRETLGLVIQDQFYAGPLDLGINPEDYQNLRSDYPTCHELDMSLIGFIPALQSLPPEFPNQRLFESAKRPGNVLQNNKNIFLMVRKAVNALLKFEFNKFNKLNTLRFIDNLLPDRIGNFSNAKVERQILEYVIEHYVPLKGSLNIQELLEGLSSNFDLNKNGMLKFADFGCRELPRFIDRYLLVALAMEVTDQLGLYGNNWNHYKLFRPHARGICSAAESINIYRRTRLNLQNNNHGIGLHPRTLQSMAAGGLIFTHSSKRDILPGGIKTVFDAGVHYADYEPENFHEKSREWLRDTDRRRRVVEEAQKLVLSNCTWDLVAQKVLKEL